MDGAWSFWAFIHSANIEADDMVTMLGQGTFERGGFFLGRDERLRGGYAVEWYACGKKEALVMRLLERWRWLMQDRGAA